MDPAAPSSRRVRAAENPASPPPTIRKSTSRSDTFELRLSLLGECAQALLGVLRPEQLLDARPLAGERVGDRHLHARVGRELDLADRGGGPAGEAVRVLERLLRDVSRGVEPVEDAEVVCL